MVKLSEAWFVAPRPLPLSIRYANQANSESRYLKFSNDLKSVLAHLNSRSTTSQIDVDDTSSSLAVAQAVQAIEECYEKPRQRQGVFVPQTIGASAARSIRHARRVIRAVESDQHSDALSRNKPHLVSLEHTIRVLRREVVRAMRYQQLELQWVTGGNLRPSSRTLRGEKAGLASFVNRVCYATTSGLGCFALPLLPYNMRRDTSDEKPFWDTDGLSISRNAEGEWVVGSVRSVASSEVTTEIENGLKAESEEAEEEGAADEYCETQAGYDDKENLKCEFSGDVDLMDEGLS